jgi:uncharacterized Rmd1/YagE family protein
MEKAHFKAHVLANEINLNQIAEACDIRRQYTWEEPLILKNRLLEPILGAEWQAGSAVYLFSFGSVVFVNIRPGDEAQVFAYLKKLVERVDLAEVKYYQDVYELWVDPELAPQEPILTDKYVIVDHHELYFQDLIAMVLAKSVGLEKIEQRLTEIMDSIEPLIDRLEKGKLRSSDRQLARVSSQIARYEYNTLAYIMLLDKPDITWSRSEALSFYDQLSDFFELTDRYEILKQKTTLLNNVVDGIASINHTLKSSWIEIAILILIMIEVVIMVVDLFK